MGTKTVYAGDSGLSYSPNPLTDGTTSVTVTYVDSGATASTNITGIIVTPILASIAVTTQPTKATYKYGDSLDLTGMVVTATMSNGTTKDVTSSATCSPASGNTLTSLGSVPISISYSETTGGVSYTKSTTTSVTVGKADGAITSYSPASPAINASNYSGLEITVNHLGGGSITSATSNDTSVVQVVSYSGNILTVKGDGNTAGSAVITLTVSGDTYYEAVTDTLNITAAYWSYGSNGDAVDEAWFLGLNNYLESHTNEEIAALITKGDNRKVTLSGSGVLGTTEHSISVIGVNQDGDQCVTFQTTNTLATNTVFNSAAWDSANEDGARWLSTKCTARAECLNYRAAFPGKKYIRAIAKGTGYATAQSRNQTYSVYNPETVWLPSEREMGLNTYAAIPVANGTTNLTGNCTQGKDFAYQLYTDNASRIKKTGDNGSVYHWWERDRYAGSNSNYRGCVCAVDNNGAAYYHGYSDSDGLAPAFVIGNSSIWGDPYELADATWFANLAAWLGDHTNAEIAKSIKVGMCKRVSLGSAVLGTTDHWIRVIGVNQDADQTIAFQTVNSLATATAWSSALWSTSDYNSALWTDSNCLARQNCEAYYNAFPGKAYIQDIKRGYCTTTDQSRAQTSVTYISMPVFLLSELEYGLDTYSAITPANSTTSNAECAEGKKFTYEFFTNQGSRIKKYGDDTSLERTAHWERSRYAGSSSDYRGYVCGVVSNGAANPYGYTNSIGLAPAFVIGKNN